jgi:hypothetical protein
MSILFVMPTKKVFPWVIADYVSKKLDLNNPATFRDLSKPVGALNEKRLEQLIERRDSFVDPNIPKFLYGSHYSTMGIVLYYLVRLVRDHPATFRNPEASSC